MLGNTSGRSPSNEPDRPRRPPATALRDALRRARVEAAQQTDVVIDLRASEIARLEILQDELESVFSQIPREIDMFDIGLVPGDRPRLFVDMVSFVEMSRDRRSYRLMRDGRHGRSVAAESDKTGPIVEAVTNYVARRLIERERLLADEDRLSIEPRRFRGFVGRTPSAGATAEADVAQEAHLAAAASEASAPAAGEPRRGWKRVVAILAAFGAGGALGVLAVFVMIVAAAKGLLPI